MWGFDHARVLKLEQLVLEIKMAKKPVVKFTLGDAPKPSKNGLGLIGLRVPHPVVLSPGGSLTINFGLSCDKPLILIPGKFRPDTVIAEAGKTITLTGHGNVQENSHFEFGEVVCYAAPIGSDFEIE